MSTFILGIQNEWYARERERERNMAALTPQSKIKGGLKWREFTRVILYNFFSSECTSQTWKCHEWRKEQRKRCNRVKKFLLLAMMNRVKTLLLLIEMQYGEDVIFVSDHWNPFQPVERTKRTNTNYFQIDLFDPGTNRYYHSESEWTWK